MSYNVQHSETGTLHFTHSETAVGIVPARGPTEYPSQGFDKRTWLENNTFAQTKGGFYCEIGTGNTMYLSQRSVVLVNLY